MVDRIEGSVCVPLYPASGIHDGRVPENFKMPGVEVTTPSYQSVCGTPAKSKPVVVVFYTVI